MHRRSRLRSGAAALRAAAGAEGESEPLPGTWGCLPAESEPIERVPVCSKGPTGDADDVDDDRERAHPGDRAVTVVRRSAPPLRRHLLRCLRARLPAPQPGSSSRHYLVPETSTSTRRSGCRQAISCLVAFSPAHSPGFVTGFDPSVPLAAILPAGIPAVSTR